jgi:hypothetical protein
MLAIAAVIPANALDVTGTWPHSDTTAKVRIYLCGEASAEVLRGLQPLDAVTGNHRPTNLTPNRKARPCDARRSGFLGLMRNSEETNGWAYLQPR